MKQLIKNPTSRSLENGWELLLRLCKEAPPEFELLEFIRVFCLYGGPQLASDEGIVVPCGGTGRFWCASYARAYLWMYFCVIEHMRGTSVHTNPNTNQQFTHTHLRTHTDSHVRLYAHTNLLADLQTDKPRQAAVFGSRMSHSSLVTTHLVQAETPPNLSASRNPLRLPCLACARPHLLELHTGWSRSSACDGCELLQTLRADLRKIEYLSISTRDSARICWLEEEELTEQLSPSGRPLWGTTHSPSPWPP